MAVELNGNATVRVKQTSDDLVELLRVTVDFIVQQLMQYRTGRYQTHTPCGITFPRVIFRLPVF